MPPTSADIPAADIPAADIPAAGAPAISVPAISVPAISVPAISVIVPVYRHWDDVGGLLAALAGQTLPPGGFEVVIVDNDPAGDSTGGPTAGRAPEDRRGWPANARLVACAAPGSYAARNAGAATARGGLLAFTDADCRPDPGWLAALADAAAATPGGLVAGPVRMTSGTPPTVCEVYERLRGIPQARYVANGYAATANLAVPAAVFRALGGFDATRFSGGDADFCRRAGRAGHPLRLEPGAVVAHPCRADWPSLAAKARRVKGGQVAAGALPRRALWTLRTLTPPLRAIGRFLGDEAPVGDRLKASGVVLALWGVELAELVRLLAGLSPERR